MTAIDAILRGLRGLDVPPLATNVPPTTNVSPTLPQKEPLTMPNDPIINPTTLNAGGIDMSVYAPATLWKNAVASFERDIPIYNDLLLKGYIQAIENWKLNRDAGHPEPIPDPPRKRGLRLDAAAFAIAIVELDELVCPKWTEPATPPPSLIAGVLMPPFAPGRYLTVLGDNAPAGYRLTTPDGVLVEKVKTPWFAGFSVEYRKVG